MIGRERTERLVKTILAHSKAEQTQVAINGETLGLTRFSNNQIHQNLLRENHTITIKVIDQKRVGTATTNSLDEGALRQVVDTALHNAQFQKANPNLADLAEPRPLKNVNALAQATLKQTPIDRAEATREIIGVANSRHLVASGTYSNTLTELAVANSRGLFAHHTGCSALLRTIINNGETTGYADQLHQDVSRINPRALAEEALWKATLKDESHSIDPGEYDTVFEAYAVADLIRFLGMIAFGGLAVQEGRSFMAKSMGQKVFADQVTITDDAFDPRSLCQPFDHDGMPKARVPIIEQGIARGVVYDSATAHREGRKSTGHSGHWGPMPSHMILEGGDSDRDEMIKKTKRGILVTRFHYTHCPEPMRVIATGTTRDGTFLIENGEITRRLKNLRFTESMIRAFANVEAISRDTRLTRDWWSTFISVLPAVKINGFTFTGSTTF